MSVNSNSTVKRSGASSSNPVSCSPSKIPQLQRCQSLKQTKKETAPSPENNSIRKWPSFLYDSYSTGLNGRKMAPKNFSNNTAIDREDLTSLRSYSICEEDLYSNRLHTRGSTSTMSIDTIGSTITIASSHCHQNQRHRYALHCPRPQEEEVYLTPTQRKDKLIKQLKSLLKKCERENDEKDNQILELSNQLKKLSTDDSHINIEDAGTLRKSPNSKSDLVDYILTSSLISNAPSQDSGHFEHISDNGSNPEFCILAPFGDKRKSPTLGEKKDNMAEHDVTFSVDDEKIRQLKTQLEDMKHQISELKEKHNDRVESLLHRLTEANDRCAEMRQQHELDKGRVQKHESEMAALKQEILEQEAKQAEMYLQMYKKGQDSAKIERVGDMIDLAVHKYSSRLSGSALMARLHSVESELDRVKTLYKKELYKAAHGEEVTSDMTLRFLRDALYHFLTDKGCSKSQHLRAIQTIMGYSDRERKEIDKAQKNAALKN